MHSKLGRLGTTLGLTGAIATALLTASPAMAETTEGIGAPASTVGAPAPIRKAPAISATSKSKDQGLANGRHNLPNLVMPDGEVLKIVVEVDPTETTTVDRALDATTSSTERAELSAMVTEDVDIIKCYSKQNTYYAYSVLNIEMWHYRHVVHWCGKNWKTVTGATQTLHPHVSKTGFAQMWSFKGNVNTGQDEYFDNNMVRMSATGNFHRCPYIEVACFGDAFPWLITDVYAAGGTRVFSGRT